MRNLELKVRCSDGAALDALAGRALAGGAVHVRTMGQRDTYFAVPRGRLKLREWRREEEGGDGRGSPATFTRRVRRGRF